MYASEYGNTRCYPLGSVVSISLTAVARCSVVSMFAFSDSSYRGTIQRTTGSKKRGISNRCCVSNRRENWLLCVFLHNRALHSHSSSNFVEGENAGILAVRRRASFYSILDRIDALYQTVMSRPDEARTFLQKAHSVPPDENRTRNRRFRGYSLWLHETAGEFFGRPLFPFLYP